MKNKGLGQCRGFDAAGLTFPTKIASPGACLSHFISAPRYKSTSAVAMASIPSVLLRYPKPRFSRIYWSSYSVMATKSYGGHLLCAIPYPEPTQVIKNIQQCHPKLKITYVQTKLPQPGTPGQSVSAGDTISFIALCPVLTKLL